MSKVIYNSLSPYKSTNQTSWFLGNWKRIDIPFDFSDNKIKLSSKYKNRPDLLSYDLYNTVQLWWVFTCRNPDVIMDPIYDMIEGVEIYAPTFERINSIIGS